MLETQQAQQCEVGVRPFWCWQRRWGAVIFVAAIVLLAAAYAWGEFSG